MLLAGHWLEGLRFHACDRLLRAPVSLRRVGSSEPLMPACDGCGEGAGGVPGGLQPKPLSAGGSGTLL